MQGDALDQKARDLMQTNLGGRRSEARHILKSFGISFGFTPGRSARGVRVEEIFEHSGSMTHAGRPSYVVLQGVAVSALPTGIVVGDTILSVNDIPCKSLSDIKRIAGGSGGPIAGDIVRMSVLRKVNIIPQYQSISLQDFPI